jgi:DNA-directed RNA polymerase subunit RPC12/RpoP
VSHYDGDPWSNHQLNEIKCGECGKEYDEQEGEGNICPTCKEKEGEKVDNLIQCDFCGEYYEHEQEKEGEQC